jgi:hypothetical protein
MRFSRIVLLAAGLAAMTACESDDVSAPNVPPVGQVRFINAVADTGAIDIRMIDQVEYSASASNLAFRAGTEYFRTEAKSRKIRVFPTNRNIAVTPNFMLEASVDVAANSRVTLLLVGSARDKSSLHFVVINDDVAAPPAGMIAVRVVNAATGAVNGYLVNAVGDALPGTATASNVAPLAASGYATKAAGNAAIRFTDAGSATVTASAAGPVASALAGAKAAAGVNSEGTKFSVYYFPRGVAGSNNNAVTTPSGVWFVDRNPAD